MTNANVKTIENQLGKNLTDQQKDQVPALLAHAQVLISDQVPSLENLLASDAAFAQIVEEVKTAAVARALSKAAHPSASLSATAQLVQLSADETARLRSNNGFAIRDAFLRFSLEQAAPSQVRELLAA